MDRSFSVPIAVICVRVGSSRCYTSLRLGALVHRLAYNGDVAAGQLAVFQGGPSRTGGKAPISGLIRVKRATRKNSQLAAARRVALKMGRRPRCSSVTSRTIFVPAGENQIGA